MHPHPVPMAMRERAELAAQLAGTLRGLGQSHFRNLDPEELDDRATDLVVAFCASLASANPKTFVTYVGGITEQRIHEGFYLDEMQAALGVLEEETWQRVAGRSGARPDVTQLRRITQTIGAAKDEMARIYLAHKERAESRTEQLEKQIEELFKGTVCPPLCEDDDRSAPGGAR